MLDVLACALDAGVRLVQLREKNLDRDVLEALAEQVLSLVARYDAMLLINSVADIAVKIGAQGVHLPGDALPRAVRGRVGPSFLIGYSTHTCVELDCADGADFVTYSPIFTPGSKPGCDGVEVGLAGLANAVAHSRLPVYALGGITPDRAAKCHATGCAGVAVMSGILAARDPARAVREFLKVWE